MGEAEVVKLLGPPFEVRTDGLSGGVGIVNRFFTYGARRPGGFAERGLVGPPDSSNRVLVAVSPTGGYGVRGGAEKAVPGPCGAVHPASNILCVINGVASDPSSPAYHLRQHVQFSLVNQSDKPIAVATPLYDLGFGAPQSKFTMVMGAYFFAKTTAPVERSDPPDEADIRACGLSQGHAWTAMTPSGFCPSISVSHRRAPIMCGWPSVFRRSPGPVTSSLRRRRTSLLCPDTPAGVSY